MPTKCEIFIRERETIDADTGKINWLAVELWKEYDGFPNFMFPFFEKFTAWVDSIREDQPYWLTYASEMAAAFIAFDYEWQKKVCEDAKNQGAPGLSPRPDVRPRGQIRDSDYLYLIDLPESKKLKAGMEMRMRCFRMSHNEQVVKAIQKGSNPPESALEREVRFKLLPDDYEAPATPEASKLPTPRDMTELFAGVEGEANGAKDAAKDAELIAAANPTATVAEVITPPVVRSPGGMANGIVKVCPFCGNAETGPFIEWLTEIDAKGSAVGKCNACLFAGRFYNLRG